MIMPLSANKLRNEHLTRPALVYVRQSTPCGQNIQTRLSSRHSAQFSLSPLFLEALGGFCP
jgi:hypothetical protein